MIASPQPLEGEIKSTPALELQQAESKQTKPANPDAEENVYLIGRPTLRGYIHFVKGHSVNPPAKAEINQDWHSAHEYIRQLEKEEAGAADHPPVTKLEVNSKYEALLIEFLKDPLVQNNFNTVPTEVAFVELDRLVVYQKHIDLTFVRQLKRKLGPTPSDEDIFRTCLSCDHSQPPVKWSRVGGDRFVFMSPSNDLRFLGNMPLKSKHLKDYPPPGSIVGVVGLAVGFGSNFLNAVCAENRIILNNGSHRAYALRDMGFTHAPCIIQHVSTRHELDIIASSAIRRAPDLYLKHPRPSMLKDYFDPKLHRVFQVHRRWKQVTVKFEVDEAYVPAL